VTVQYWGSLHLVAPDWTGDPDASDAEAVVDSCRYGFSHISVAVELWRLVGDEERAARIESVVSRAFGDSVDTPVGILKTADIEELLGLLEGLQDALRGSVVDARFQVSAAQLPELRRRTTLLNFNEGDHVAEDGVAEGMGRVTELMMWLRRALDGGLHVAIE
jgi:hypothetical protein